MSNDTDLVLDRRRLRRKLGVWRVGAILAVLLALAALVARGNESAFSGTSQIARLSFEGTITEDRKMLQLIKEIGEEKHVKGVLLFVNSPGGTTTGGEGIYEAVRKIAKTKPVVAQFSTLATSAGYIVGLSADHIVARGNTITGSVGVLMQYPQLTEMFKKLGVEMKTIRSGNLKALPNPFEPDDPEARAMTQQMVDEGFNWFMSLVEQRRSIRADGVPGLKEGGIFSGRDALSHKLVDEIGGEAEAINWLKEKRGVGKDVKVVDRTPVENDFFGLGAGARIFGAFWDGLMARVFGSYAQLLGAQDLRLDGLVSVWHPQEN